MNHSKTFVLPSALYLAAVAACGPWINFPLNDEWVYALDSARTLANGTYTVTGYESAWGIPQVLFGSAVTAFFGGSAAALRFSGIAATLGSGWILFLYLRRVSRSTPVILCSLGAFFFFPPLFIVSASFMTDAPFLFFLLATCYCWERALEEDRSSFLLAGAAAYLVCVSQRQFGIVVPAVAAALVVARSDFPGRRAARLAVFAVCLAVPYFILRWWQTLESSWSPALGGEPHLGRTFLDLHGAWLYLGIGLFPLLFFCFRVPVSTRRAYIIWALACATIARGWEGGWMPYFGNLISEFGVFRDWEVLPGTRAEQLSGPLRMLLTLVCFGGACAPLFASASREERGSRVFGTLLFAVGMVYLGAAAFRAQLFDRYLVPVFAAAVVYTASRAGEAGRRRTGAALAALFALGSFSFTLLFDYLRWSEAKLEVARKLVENGAAPGKIHAGYEWNGVYGHGSHPPSSPAGYDYAVSFSQLEGYDVVAEEAYVSCWPPFRRVLYGLRPRSPGA